MLAVEDQATTKFTAAEPIASPSFCKGGGRIVKFVHALIDEETIFAGTLPNSTTIWSPIATSWSKLTLEILAVNAVFPELAPWQSPVPHWRTTFSSKKNTGNAMLVAITDATGYIDKVTVIICGLEIEGGRISILVMPLNWLTMRRMVPNNIPLLPKADITTDEGSSWPLEDSKRTSGILPTSIWSAPPHASPSPHWFVLTAAWESKGVPFPWKQIPPCMHGGHAPYISQGGHARQYRTDRTTGGGMKNSNVDPADLFWKGHEAMNFTNTWHDPTENFGTWTVSKTESTELRNPIKLQADPSQSTLVSALVNETKMSCDEIIGGNPITAIVMDTPSADPVLPSTLALFGLIAAILGIWKYVNNPLEIYRWFESCSCSSWAPALFAAVGIANTALNDKL
jgi:hypothetical protein